MESVFQTPEIIHQILGYLTILELKRVVTTCTQWRNIICKDFDLRLVLVTLSGTNELALLSTSGDIVQRFPVLPSRKGKKRKRIGSTTSARRRQDTAYCWPTCTTIGPNGNLFVSQYKVQGILEFKRSREGFAYRRIFASGTSFSSPEGVVIAHNSVYVVSVENETVTRLTLDHGRVIEQASDAGFGYRDLQGEEDVSLTLWGVCISPDQRSLFIAAHRSDHGSVLVPTSRNTGKILRLDLEDDGSFMVDREGYPIGYYEQLLEQVSETDTSFVAFNLNRPSNPVFCPHGILHVSSFVSSVEGERRRIRRFACSGYPWVGPTRDLGWLEEDGPADENKVNPWGVGFSQRKGEVFATCANAHSASPCLVKMASCGCESTIIQTENANPIRPNELKYHHFDLSSFGRLSDALPTSSGACTTLVGNGEFEHPTYVHVID
jgi:hypothetical protein